MEFEKITKTVELLAPPDFESQSQLIEYRLDPLTGSRCLINTKRAERAKQAENMAHVSDAITTETAKGCFFCSEHLESETPKFPPDICAEGRIERGECTVFPNLFAFAEYHAVATLSHAHFLDLDQFTPEMIVDNMLASQEWMRTVHQKNPTAKWPIFIWNHLPPSGASIVHPHVQALVREMSTAMQEQLLARSKVYFAKKGHSFWQELVETERELGQRYIGHNDSLSVIAGFAPRGFREIHFIFDDTSSFTHLDENQIRDFADAIIKVLRGYKSMGVGSFNLNVFSGPIDENSEHYLLNAKMISRPFPQGVYSSDTGPFERLQDEWVIEFLPEDVAQRMRAVWACS